ncbi:MAG: hypothetical protein IPH12_07265 [Saprospirales bacterium]|nr:hypothetical protein [Saprospirales bacterium]
MTIRLFFSLVLTTLLACCTITATAQKTKTEGVRGTCRGLPLDQRTRIAVAKFTVTAPSANGVFGDNLATMLSNTLVETNCFRVLESSKNLEDLSKEIELNQNGMLQQGTGPKAGQMLGAQLLISGEITEFSENESGGGGGALLGKVVGGIGLIRAHVGFILKIVNPATRDILASRSFERKVTKVGGIGGGVIGGIPIGGLGFKSKAMADAVEEAILASSQWLTEEKQMLLDAVGSSGVKASPAFGKGNCPVLQSGNAPTVMVIIPEVHITQRIPDPAGETEIIRRLIEAGFKVLDPSGYKTIRESAQLNAALKDASAASAIGTKFGADIIIIGEAFSQSAGAASGNLRSCAARVEARAIRTSNAQIIGADGQHAGGIDITELTAAKIALRNAGALMADYFVDQLCQVETGNTRGSGNQSEILLANVNFAKLARIESGLTGLKGVQAVHKSLSGSTGKIELSHSCPLDEIALALSEGKTGVTVEITGFDKGKLEGVVK